MSEYEPRSLDTDMLAYRRYPEKLRAAVNTMVEAWKGFCALPEETRRQFGYTTDELVSGAGYELKKDLASGFDLKENFHVRPNKREFLYGEAERIGAPEMRAFLDAAYAVYPELLPLVLEFAETTEREYGIAGLAADVAPFRRTPIIRLLHYFGSETGTLLGAPHADKGGFTGHLYESHPGVERLTREGAWVPMDVAEGEAMFFAGLGLQHRSRSALIAPCHRIVATAETARAGRWSAVCFTEIERGRHFDKSRFGRQQDLTPGFNYLMPFPEFDRYFVDERSLAASGTPAQA
jgi:hypothetical protein